MELAVAEFLAHAPVFVRERDGRITHWTSGAAELYGYSEAEALGAISHELLQTVFPEPRQDIERKLRDSGAWKGLLQHVRADGAELWVESQWKLRPSEAGDVVVEINMDITARIVAERHRDLLARELDHRVKNTLALVQGLARMSFSGQDTADLRRFEDRLLAVAQAYDLLRAAHWETADLSDIVHHTFEALHLLHRVSISGEGVQLTPNAALAYSLAIHELATNAIKHGALSQPGGRVEIAWRIYREGAENIHFVWRETGGPPVSPPTREGFGSRLIKRAVSQELGAPVAFRYDPSGFICEFDGPIQKESMVATAPQPA